MSTRMVLVAGIGGIAGFATAIVGVISGILAIDSALAAIAVSLVSYVGALIAGALLARAPSGIRRRNLVVRRSARSSPPERWERDAVLH